MKKTIYSVVCTTMDKSSDLVSSRVINSFTDESRAIQCRDDAFDNAVNEWADFEEDDYTPDLLNSVIYSDDKVEMYSVETNDLLED